MCSLGSSRLHLLRCRKVCYVRYSCSVVFPVFDDLTREKPRGGGFLRVDHVLAEYYFTLDAVEQSPETWNSFFFKDYGVDKLLSNWCMSTITSRRSRVLRRVEE